MRRSPRFVVASCTAALVGVATAYTVGTDLATLHRRARDLGPVRPAVVAVRAVPLGAKVAPDDLTTVDRHTSALPDDALLGADEIVGRVVAVPLVRGAVVQSAHLAPDERGLDGIVPPGHRLVRVVTADSAPPGPGAVVDVLVAFDPTAVVGAGRAEAVARGALVVADDVHATTEGSSGVAGAAPVTLLVTEDEAYDLAFAAANGTLTLAVAPPEAACCTSSEP